MHIFMKNKTFLESDSHFARLMNILLQRQQWRAPSPKSTLSQSMKTQRRWHVAHFGVASGVPDGSCIMLEGYLDGK